MDSLIINYVKSRLTLSCIKTMGSNLRKEISITDELQPRIQVGLKTTIN